MGFRFARRCLLGLALLLLLAGRASAGEARVAIGGYDTVAYFTDAKPVPGRSDIGFVWHHARWQFASPRHRDLFARNPERYAPQYDGYCAMGAAIPLAPHKDVVDPHAWAIVNGKLYLTHSRAALKRWRQNPAENIARGNRHWPELKKEHIVYNGYPNGAHRE
jgi:hypothetical protein